MKAILTLCALIGMTVGGFAQTIQKSPEPDKTPVATRDAANAPVEPESFTEDQARSHIEEMGYSDVEDLHQGEDGLWRGKAEKAGASVVVTVDDQGNVTEGAE